MKESLITDLANIIFFLVIGDEILSGSQVDTNSNFLCKRLHQKGVIVKKVIIISDVVSEIAKTIKYCSNNYDIVITTGGIGPTHDDLTYEGLAKAFDDQLELNSELKKVFDNFLNKYKQREDAEEAILKFCSVSFIFVDSEGFLYDV